VCEPSGNKHLTLIFAAEPNRYVLAESRRAFSDINGDIENLPLDDPHQFRLGMGRKLIMKSSQHPIRAFRFIVLTKRDSKP
jgi:hypothetical protein